MSCPSTCATGTADNLDDLELLGRLALSGDISWREAARRGGLSHHAGLKNHMEKHVVAVEVEAKKDRMTEMVDATIIELEHSWEMAPTDVKPLILVAIQNLQYLVLTKPSQEHLMRALKTAQEMTGMKNEQRMLLAFAEAAASKMFPGAPAPTPIESKSRIIPAIEK